MTTSTTSTKTAKTSTTSTDKSSKPNGASILAGGSPVALSSDKSTSTNGATDMAAKKKTASSKKSSMKPILPIRGIINELGMASQIEEGKPLKTPVKNAIRDYIMDKLNGYVPGNRGPRGPRISQEEVDATVAAVKAALESLPGDPASVPIQALVYPYMMQKDAPHRDSFEGALAHIRKIGKPAVNPKTKKATKRQESYILNSSGPTTNVEWIG